MLRSLFRNNSNATAMETSNNEIITLEIISAKINITENAVMLPTKVWFQITSLKEADDLIYKIECTKQQDRIESNDLVEFKNAW